jgi:hypothetical protein
VKHDQSLSHNLGGHKYDTSVATIVKLQNLATYASIKLFKYD